MKRSVDILVSMTSDDAEKLIDALKGNRHSWALRIRESVGFAVDGASWATTGKMGDMGASLTLQRNRSVTLNSIN